MEKHSLNSMNCLKSALAQEGAGWAFDYGTARVGVRSIRATEAQVVGFADLRRRNCDGGRIEILPHRGRGTAKRWRGLTAHPASDVIENGLQISQYVSRRNAKDVDPTQV